MSQSRGKVLLTGGTGFIASHILDELLREGFTVVTTVRTADKGDAILASIDEALRPRVSYVLVADMAQDGAFDEAVHSVPPFDYVVHTASPYQLRVDDPVRDLLDPAMRGTAGLLRSVRTQAPGVRRVVLTSSSAAMLNPRRHAAVYDEACWRPVTWAEAQQPENAYEASKVFAERAAWAFVNGREDEWETASETAAQTASETASSTAPFDLAVVNCTYTFGPVQRWLTRLDAVNASNQRIRDLVLGRWRRAADGAGGMPPTRPVFTWVDVRDVARAHVRALVVPAAGGRRFYVVGGHFSNGRLAAVLRAAWAAAADGGPQSARLRARLPAPEQTPDDLPADVYRFDNRRSRAVLGLAYRSLEASVLDTAASLLALEARASGDGRPG